jgi:hypothetical protein
VTSILSRRKIFLGALIAAVFISGTFWAQEAFWPFGPSYLRQPALSATPPLKPNTRTSVVTLPVAVALTALRTTLDAAAPRSFTGKHENPQSDPFGKTDIGWTIGRGPIALAGRPEGLTLSATLSGTLRITDQAAVPAKKGAGGRADSLTGVLNPDIERAVQDLVKGALDQRGEIRGNAMLIARPTLLPNWRIDPKLSGHAIIADGGLSIAGITVDVSEEVKSIIDRTVTEQVNLLQTRLRNDSTIEQVARREWAKMCRSISLASVAAGTPNLWLELRPIRVFASQPLIDAATITLTVGAEAETRIVSTATKPNCPFPAQLEIVPPLDHGRFAVAAPIEVPFTEISRILNAQLKGRTFPENADAAAQITVLSARVAPSGDRLLISLLVKAREQATWFGFDAKATVYIWVRPVLDRAQQMIRLTDLVLDVQSNAAFGLLGAAARTAIPYFQVVLEESAVIDLKPYAASARTGIAAIIADFDKRDDGLSTDAAVTGLRLVGIEFDSKTLRVIAEAEGTAKIAVTRLPKR